MILPGRSRTSPCPTPAPPPPKPKKTIWCARGIAQKKGVSWGLERSVRFAHIRKNLYSLISPTLGCENKLVSQESLEGQWGNDGAGLCQDLPAEPRRGGLEVGLASWGEGFPWCTRLIGGGAPPPSDLVHQRNPKIGLYVRV